MLLSNSVNLFFFNMYFFMSFIFFLMFIFMKVYGFVYMVDWVFFFFSYDLSMVFYFDWTSLMFGFLVSMISGFIFKYMMYYCQGYKNMYRFIMLVFCFVMSMLLLIFTPNSVSLLLGWDGLGLSSYLLIIYYYSNISYVSGMITILSNRIGDGLIIVLIGLLMFNCNCSLIYEGGNSGYIEIIFLVLACMTKSAQMPFVAWLPLAMAAPTPVSALVHSSTLVTAGIYLVYRSGLDMLSYSSIGFILMVSSLLTSFVSSLSACFISDFKKIVAMSTMSQLGLMMFSLSLGLNEFCYFHMLSHAIFKFIMFMWVGFFMSESSHNQDFRFYNFSGKYSGMLSLGFLIVHMCLFGFPFLSSFYSKDKLLELSYSYMSSNMIMLFLLVISGMTLGYSVRMLMMGFSGYSMSFTGDLSSKDFYGSFFFFYILFFISGLTSFFLYWFLQDYLYLLFCLNMFDKFGLFFVMVMMLFCGLSLINYFIFLNSMFHFVFFMKYINYILNMYFNSNILFLYNFFMSSDKGYLDNFNFFFLKNLKDMFGVYIYKIQNFYFLSGFFYFFFVLFFMNLYF